jgi:hypothetical protein
VTRPPQPTSSDFEDDGAVKASKIDLGKARFFRRQRRAQIGERGRGKLLTVERPTRQTAFNGPVGAKEDLDKMPADVHITTDYSKMTSQSRRDPTKIARTKLIRTMQMMRMMMTRKPLNQYRSRFRFHRIRPR